MRAIFISYRRSDSEGEAGRLSDLLIHRFSNKSVFMDVDSIQPGRDFRKAIDESIKDCSVLLALIGPQWLEAHDDNGGRRLDAPNDYVRLEIAAALRRDISVIPVLLRGAKMPHEDQLPAEIAELAFRNSVELTHARWKSDLQVLTDALESLIGAAPPAPATTPPPELRPELRPDPRPVQRPAYTPPESAHQPTQLPSTGGQTYIPPSQRNADRSRIVSPNRNLDAVVHPYRPPPQPPDSAQHTHRAQAHPPAPLPAQPPVAVAAPIAPPISPQAAPAPVAVAAPATPGTIPDATIEKLTRQLAHFIGPIAEIVVKRAARRTGTTEELASLVSQEIESTTDRAKFLNVAGQ